MAGRCIRFSVRVIISLATGFNEWSECKRLKIKPSKWVHIENLLKTYKHSVSVFSLKLCAALSTNARNTKGYWKQFESFILDWINEYKNIWGWMTVRNHRKYLQMRYLQEGTGYLKSAFPKWAKIERKRETPKWSEQVLKSTPGLWTTARHSELLFRGKALQLHHITQMAHFIRMTAGC